MWRAGCSWRLRAMTLRARKRQGVAVGGAAPNRQPKTPAPVVRLWPWHAKRAPQALGLRPKTPATHSVQRREQEPRRRGTGSECAAPGPAGKAAGAWQGWKTDSRDLHQFPWACSRVPTCPIRAVSLHGRRAVASRGRAAYQMSCSEVSSFTMRLSRGDRPVLAPEYAVNAPLEAMAEPISYTRASSYKAATDGLGICCPLAVLFPQHVTAGSAAAAGQAKAHVQWRLGHSQCVLCREVRSLWSRESV